MDINSDLPIAVPDDSDDAEGDDQLHDIGGGDEGEENDDMATIEQAITAMQSTAEPATDIAVPAADVAPKL